MKNTSKKRKLAAVDIETALIVPGKSRYDLPIKSVAVSTDTKSVYTAVWDDETASELNQVIDELYDDNYSLVFHNGKFDVGVLRKNNVRIPYNTPGASKPLWHDTMCLSYTIHPSEMRHHGLGVLAELVDEKKLSMVHDDLLEYNLQDALITAKLAHLFLDMLDEEEPGLKEYYLDIELPYIEILIQFESTGLYVDRESLQQVKAEYEKGVKEIQQKIDSLCGFQRGTVTEYRSLEFSHYEQFTKDGKVHQRPYYVGVHKTAKGCLYGRCDLVPLNTNSGTQVVDALKRLYGFKPTKFTAKGTPKTDSKTLESIDKKKYPLVDWVLEKNKMDSMLSKFFNSIGELSADTGFIFGDFNQFNTRTRRLSSANPNLQNIPGRDERGATIRKMFIPPKDYTLVCGDLDRIELVVLSYYLEEMTGSMTLSSMIREGVDVHTVNAETWGVDRPVAKNGIFCIVYGGGRNKLAETLGISRKSAGEFLEAVQEHLPEIFDLRDSLIDLIRSEKGFLYDFFGGRIYIPEVLSTDPNTRASGERKTFNYMIQGTAASIFKYLQMDAYWTIRSLYPDQHTLVKFAAPIHDELLVYVHSSIDADEIADLLTKTFSRDDIFPNIPVRAKFKTGENWYVSK